MGAYRNSIERRAMPQAAKILKFKGLKYMKPKNSQELEKIRSCCIGQPRG